MAVNRPFMNQCIEELQQLYEKSIDDRKTLNKISRELAHRTTKKSKILRKQVRESVVNIEQRNSSGQSDNQSEQKSHQQETKESAIAFSCQSCKTKIKLYSDAKSGNYRCPSCKAKFVVSYLQGRLEILFADTPNSSTSEKRENIITFDEALRILESQRGDSLDVIRVNRKKLMQQYHPDKVASLGPKLRELAANSRVPSSTSRLML